MKNTAKINRSSEYFQEKIDDKKPDYFGHRQRIKNKLSSHPESLLEYELLEILLFGVFSRKDTKSLAKKILNAYDGSLTKLFCSDFSKILEIDGLGASAYSLFKAVSWIYKKINSEILLSDKISIDNFDSLIAFLRSHIAFAKKENFCEIFLNSQLEVIKYKIYDYGTIDEIAIYCKDIVFKALECGAKNIIISHNHPSQSNEIIPSEKDKIQTQNLLEMCLTFGIEFVDHVIVSGDKYFSFYSNGLL